MYWTITAWSAAVLLPLLALNAIVVAFTYPWDNSAVRRGIWDFPEDRLLFRIDKLPIEEISFFVLQTLQVSFLTLALCSAIPAVHRYEPVISIGTLTNAGLLFVVWGIIGLTTRRWRTNHRRYAYAWHLFYWFVPVICVQWIIGSALLSERLVVILGATFIIGSLLSIADVWAVRRGIWFFDHTQITGHVIARILPWEEVAFFYTTSLLVSQSILLLAPESLR